MTKKDFEFVARVIAYYNQQLKLLDTSSEEYIVLQEVAIALGRAFDARYERFDYDKFIKACLK
jgi:hypothetical protein